MAEQIDIQIKLDGIRALGTLKDLERSLGVIDDEFAKTIKSQEKFSLAVAKSTAQNMNSLSSFARAAISLNRQRSAALKQEEQERKRLTRIREEQARKEQAAIKQNISSLQRLKQEIKNTYSGRGLADTLGKLSIPALGSQASSTVNFLKDAANIASDMLGYRNALQLALGTQEKASAEMQFAIQIARDLKLNITVLMREYSKFSNSMQLAGVSTEKTRLIFQQFAGAARVLNLSAERTSGMFLALEQMVSKGTVSMEELRRQLGDHLPGALNLAAEAMGYGQNELKKFMKDVQLGKVESAELVEKLGELVSLRTKDLVPVSLQKYSANVQALTNEFTLLQAAIGELAAEFIFNPLIESAAWLLREINLLLGPLELLGKEIKATTIFTEQLTNTFTTASTAMEPLVSSSDQLVKSTEDVNTNLNLMQKELEPSVAGLALLGVTGTTVTGMFISAVKAIYSFVKVGLTLAKDGISLLIKGLKSTVKWLKILGSMLLATPWGRFAALVGGGAAALYALVKSANSTSQALSNLEPYAENIAEKLDNIANKGLDENSIISEGAIAVAKQRLDNVANELNRIKRLQKEVNQQVATGGGDPIVNEIIGLTNLTNANAGATALDATTNAYNELKDAYFNGNFTLNDIAPSGVAVDNIDKMDKAFAKLVASFTNVSPVTKFRQEMQAIINAMAEGPERDLLQQKLETQVATLGRLKEAHDKEKAARKQKKTIKNIYEAETLQIEKLIGAQKLAIQQIGKTEIEQTKLTAQYQHLLRIKELDMALSQKKLSLNERDKLVEQSRVVRDLVVANKALTEEYEKQEKATKELNASKERGNQLLEDSLPEMERYMIWAEKAVADMKNAGASQEEMLRVLKQGWEQMITDAEEASITVAEMFKEAMGALQTSLADGFFDVMQGETENFFKNIVTNFKRSVDRMVADALAAELMKALFGGGQQFPGGNIFSMLAGSGGGAGNVVIPGGSLGGGDPFATGDALLGNLFGLAKGGSFRVGGVGGVDSQLVAFKATPSEKVSVTTPSQENVDSGSNIYMTVNAQDAGSFNESRDQIIGNLMSAMSQARRNM